jgi:hypothetical protein
MQDVVWEAMLGAFCSDWNNIPDICSHGQNNAMLLPIPPPLGFGECFLWGLALLCVLTARVPQAFAYGDSPCQDIYKSKREAVFPFRAESRFEALEYVPLARGAKGD